MLRRTCQSRAVIMIAGEQVRKILIDGDKPGDLSIRPIDQYAYVINITTAKKIGLLPSLEFLQIVQASELSSLANTLDNDLVNFIKQVLD